MLDGCMWGNRSFAILVFRERILETSFLLDFFGGIFSDTVYVYRCTSWFCYPWTGHMRLASRSSHFFTLYWVDESLARNPHMIFKATWSKVAHWILAFLCYWRVWKRNFGSTEVRIVWKLEVFIQILSEHV